MTKRRERERKREGRCMHEIRKFSFVLHFNKPLADDHSARYSWVFAMENWIWRRKSKNKKEKNLQKERHKLSGTMLLDAANIQEARNRNKNTSDI
jgi:hypothetical protein